MAFGVYGKHPAKGDFLSHGVPPAVQARLEVWLDAALAEARAALGADWQSVWPAAPALRLWLGEGIWGEAGGPDGPITEPGGPPLSIGVSWRPALMRRRHVRLRTRLAPRTGSPCGGASPPPIWLARRFAVQVRRAPTGQRNDSAPELCAARPGRCERAVAAEYGAAIIAVPPPRSYWWIEGRSAAAPPAPTEAAPLPDIPSAAPAVVLAEGVPPFDEEDIWALAGGDG